MISWGKPRIKIAKLGAGGSTTSLSWIELPTPVENSTKLNATKGDKKEAKIEGGAAEAVRYSANSYELELSIRAAIGRTKPIADLDGFIDGQYALVLQPEDPKAPGLQIDRCNVSVLDSYNSENGIVWTYTFSALKPANGELVKQKVINIDAPSLA